MASGSWFADQSAASGGGTETLTYDQFGRRESQTRADGTRTVFALTACSAANSYCSGAGDLRFRVDASSYDNNDYNTVVRTDSQYFDAFGRPRYTDAQLADGAISRTIVSYDSLGRVATQSVPHKLTGLAGTTQFQYDLLNRLLTATRQASETDTSNIQTTIAYAGLTEERTDAENKRHTFTRDAFGRIVRAMDALDTQTRYVYDGAGNLRRVFAADNLPALRTETVLTYGPRGQKLSSNDPDMGSWAYQYSPFGELKSQLDANGRTVNFEYDALSRLAKRTEDEGITLFAYDDPNVNGIGQLTSVTATGYQESYQYDGIGRPLNRQIVIGAESFDYDFEYGANGQLRTLTYPQTTGSRLAVEYSYSRGWLQQVRQVGSTVFWQVDAANARGQVTQATLGNGVVRQHTIDAITGLVSHIRSGPGGGYGLQNESYLFDNAGNLVQRQNGNAGLTEDFFYDDLHRLDYSTLGGLTNLDMAYDALGNVTNRSDIAGGAAWTYHNTKKRAVTQAGPHSYSYDPNGNAITRNGYEIKWTSFNLPYEINGPGKKLTFSYGPERARYRQVYQNGSTSETTLYVGGLLEKVEIGAVTDWRHSIIAGGETVALVSRKSSGTNATWYLLKDHLGSVAKILNSSGAEYVSESFAAFGARRDPNTWSGPCPCPELDKIKQVTRRGYTEHEMIGGQSMGLIHMNGRVQDAVIGRFLSADPFVQAPFNLQSLNRYSYVFNNPLSATDPSGFDCEPVNSPDLPAGLETCDDEGGNGGNDSPHMPGSTGGYGPGVPSAQRAVTSRGALADSTVSGTDFWKEWGRFSLWWGNAVADYGRSVADDAGEFAYASGRVWTGRGTRRDIAIVGIGYVVAGLNAVPGGGAADDIARVVVWRGAGPIRGTFGVGPATRSVKGLQNFFPRRGAVEFVFDPATSTFVVGNGTLKHDALATAIGADPTRVVGGIFSRGPNGLIMTNEASGHFWANWTSSVRQQFVDFMNSKGLTVVHREGM